MRSLVSILLLWSAMSGAASAAEAPKSVYDQVAVSDGAIVAERECSRCHAIGKLGPSPRADAPEFRYILSRYRADALETDLVEGVKRGHPDMPLFQLNPKAVADLIAYLKSIQQ
jgi:mono/diheme cytochrome c family protein